jgi:hypothetical protein
MKGGAPRNRGSRLPAGRWLDLRLDGVRAADDGQVAVLERLAARGANRERVELRATGVREDDRLGARVAVPVAPFLERMEHEVELVAGLGQHVLVTQRPLLVRATLDQPGLLELAQPCGQDVARRTGGRGDVAELVTPYRISRTTSSA